MANNDRVEDILRELNNTPAIQSSVVVSRSGMHIAGSPPAGVHLETFVAMSAILLGSAETAISELKGELESVLVELDRSRIIIEGAGRKALLVVVSDTKENLDALVKKIKTAAKEIEKEL